MGRKNAANKFLPFNGKMDNKKASIRLMALTSDQFALFEIINDHCHIAAASKNFLADFTLGQRAQVVKGLEDAKLAERLTRFMLELGKGFAFVGRQYHLEVGEQDFYIDLLFYHLKLHCYVVIELKSGPFKPEYAGKLNFYLTAVDEEVKTPEDNPSIGLILCRDRDNVVAEYALRDLNKPIGVSGYELSATLPESLRASLPTLEEVEEGLADERREET